MPYIPGDGELIALGQTRQVKVYYDESASQLTIEVPAASDGIALPVGTLHVQDGSDQTQGSGARTTAVTMSKFSGQITGDDASLAALIIAKFTVTNSLVDPEDHVIITKVSGDVDSMAWVSAVGSGSYDVSVINLHASVADTTFFVFNVLVIKGSKT